MRHPVRALVFVLLFCFTAFLLACRGEPAAESSPPTAETPASAVVEPQNVPSSDRPATAVPPPQPAASEDAPRLPAALTFQKSKDFQGTIFDLQGCTQTVRQIRCELLVTNTGIDREYRIDLGDRTQLFDQRSHQFPSTRIVFADVDTSRYDVRKYLITETPTRMTIFFDGVPSSIEFIKVLAIGTRNGVAQLRDIRFTPSVESLEGTL